MCKCVAEHPVHNEIRQLLFPVKTTVTRIPCSWFELILSFCKGSIACWMTTEWGLFYTQNYKVFLQCKTAKLLQYMKSLHFIDTKNVQKWHVSMVQVPYCSNYNRRKAIFLSLFTGYKTLWSCIWWWFCDISVLVRKGIVWICLILIT